jgi:hypothetical protein
VSGTALAHSSPAFGEEAARVIGRAILGLFPIDGASVADRLSTELLVRVASNAAERQVDRPDSLVACSAAASL